MFGADSMTFGRVDLSLGIREPLDEISVLVVYLVHLLVTEIT
jgi:hypothetical protein